MPNNMEDLFNMLKSFMPNAGMTQQQAQQMFQDRSIEGALGAADQSIEGAWPMPMANSFSDFPLLPMDTFSSLTPDQQDQYMAGIRRLPDPNLSMMFGLPYDTRWSAEMIDQYMQPFMDIRRTGQPQQPQLGPLASGTSGGRGGY